MEIIMQIEQKKQNQLREHSLVMDNRRKISLTGVDEVESFSESAVTLKTCMGGLIIKGKSLTINKLNTDTGELDVNGEVSSIQYTAKKSESLFSGLFK
ncbi:MAG: sporulation protein YabP [Oscillospiraceae bacterium]|nr:sporulation protein YabP [Oscillospiraceae bacterium]